VSVVTYDSALTRSDLPIPLPPLRGLPLLMRSYLVGLRAPRFASAYRVTSAVAAAAVISGAVSFNHAWRQPMAAIAAVLGLYAIARAVALAIFEMRQHAFEQEWIPAQSRVLQEHAFEILRFTIQDGADAGLGARRAVDLTRQSDISDLLRRQQAERAAEQPSRATVEFTYRSADGTPALGEVHRDLPELRFTGGWPGPPRAWIRFPEARYLGRPGSGRRPYERTIWALTGSALITVTDSAYAPAAGAGSASTASAAGSGGNSVR
jgi:hypothetical protein